VLSRLDWQVVAISSIDTSVPREERGLIFEFRSPAEGRAWRKRVTVNYSTSGLQAQISAEKNVPHGSSASGPFRKKKRVDLAPLNVLIPQEDLMRTGLPWRAPRSLFPWRGKGREIRLVPGKSCEGTAVGEEKSGTRYKHQTLETANGVFLLLGRTAPYACKAR